MAQSFSLNVLTIISELTNFGWDRLGYADNFRLPPVSDSIQRFVRFFILPDTFVLYFLDE